MTSQCHRDVIAAAAAAVSQAYIYACQFYAAFFLNMQTAEWLACWTQAQKSLGSNRSRDTLSSNSLRQTVHTHCASVHQAAKLVAALLRVARVTAGLAKSNGSLPSGLWLTSPAGWLPRTGSSAGTLRSVIEHGLPLPFYADRINTK